MKLDTYKIDVLLAERGQSMRSAGIDNRYIIRAKQGKETNPKAVYKIAQRLGVSPEAITIRE